MRACLSSQMRWLDRTNTTSEDGMKRPHLEPRLVTCEIRRRMEKGEEGRGREGENRQAGDFKSSAVTVPFIMTVAAKPFVTSRRYRRRL